MSVGRGETNHVFVDVDGTLLVWPTKPGSPHSLELEAARRFARGEPLSALQAARLPRVNAELVRALKLWQEQTGGTIVIWTMGGRAHAELARTLCWLDGAVCIAKPDLAVDDAGEAFRKKLPVCLPGDFPPRP